MNPFNDTADRYDEWFERNDKIFCSEVDCIKECAGELGDAFEVGVGTGIFAKALRITKGIEPSTKMLEYALKKGIEVENTSIEEYVPKDKYDTVLFCTVDCFISNFSQAIAKAKDMLKRDGKIIVAFLDSGSKLGKVYEENKDKDDNYKYAKFHSYIDMKNIAEENDMHIDSVKQTIFKLENVYQESEDGHGKGLFCVIKIGGNK